MAEAAGELATKLLGQPCEELGGLVADQIQHWRFCNRVRLLNKVEAKIKECNADPRVLPHGFFVPLLTEAGNVEEDELQDLWANLVAAAVQDDGACQRSYVETLKNLSVPEAKLLQMLAAKPRGVVVTTGRKPENRGIEQLEGSILAATGFTTPGELMAGLSRLTNAGCVLVRAVRREFSRNGNWLPEQYRHVSHDFERKKLGIYLSTYGARFLERCTGKPVNPESVKEPWALLDEVRQMAADAGRAASLGLAAC